ncbi:hypothetical protein [Peribacillus sp. NPDC056705]|uniref:hypothetical protein n=1 Tax=Peribacillus sp. NPDC056705 TaxID=3345918 RepID=UPI00374902D6
MYNLIINEDINANDLRRITVGGIGGVEGHFFMCVRYPGYSSTSRSLFCFKLEA